MTLRYHTWRGEASHGEQHVHTTLIMTVTLPRQFVSTFTGNENTNTHQPEVQWEERMFPRMSVFSAGFPEFLFYFGKIVII